MVWLGLELADVATKESALGPIHEEEETCPDRDLLAKVDRSPHVFRANASIDQALAHIQGCAATTNIG